MRTTRFASPFVILTAAIVTSVCAGGAESGGLQPCELLSSAQVAGVLPEPSKGMATHSGGSLIAGVDAYQCSYINPNGDMLTVILNLAVDDARFAEIKPDSEVLEDRQRVEAGDEGWMSVATDEVKVKAIKGRAVIDIELMASDAADKSAQLIELAKAVAAKIP